MSTPPPNAAPAPPPPGTPQVLLFGYTGAGKSALLGALLKAAETQGPTLRGEVLESSGRLASIRDAVYRGDDLERTDAELTSYVVRLRPWREGARVVTEPVTVVLHDCAGKAAESLIEHPEALSDKTGRPPVARAVVEADAIVLLVDAAADDEELQQAFEEFDTFLTIVSRAKTNAREVGGFPVLLVLTQCDRLARPGDTYEAWEERVNARADRAWAKFDAFLKDAEPEEGVPSPFLPFGSIDLTVYSVAVRMPRLTGVPAGPNVPYRVAELFRDCFAVAKTHRDRVTASDRRLKWTVRLAMGFIAVLFLGVVGMAVFQPHLRGTDLAERVRAYELQEPPAATRLSYPMLTRNKATLADFRQDRAFPTLPEEQREFVLSRLKEIEDYEAYRARLAAATAPGDTRTLDDLARVEKGLREGLDLPGQYAWGETGAAHLHDKWVADAAAIRKAEAGYLDRYREFGRRGVVLTLRPSLGEGWRDEVGALLTEASRPPAPLNDPLPGSPALDQQRGEPVTVRVPYEFERVYTARKDWDAIRDRLAHLRDLADALGLTAGMTRPDAVLVLPEPGPGVDSAALPASRVANLLRTYSGVSPDFREWDVRNFPDPVRTLLSDRLDRSFRTGARHVQALLRARLGTDPKDTSDAWRSLADVLGDPATPYPEWGRFLHLLAKLRDPGAPNPVGELASFLRKGEFELDPREFTLVVPPDLSFDKVVPAGPLTVSVASGTTTTTKTFKQVGAGVREGSATRYSFTADGTGKLTYHPGDEVRAELPVRAGAQEFKLVWETTRSRAYQFDKLAHAPKLVKAGGASEPAAGVRLTPSSDSTLPSLPVLFPDLKR